MKCNIISKLLATFAITLCMLSQALAYTPPIGIPTPTFGIYDEASTLPSPWDSNEADFFYIKSGGSNSGNGYPGNPRGSIPSSAMNAGSVIVIEGEYTSQESLTFNGTAENPIFVISANTSQATLKMKWTLKGSYFVFDGINGAWDNSSVNGKVNIVNADHAVYKNSDLRGDTNDGIGGIIVSDSDNVLLYKNVIHDSGNFLTTIDQDVHGTTVGNNTSNLWILDSEYYRNSGNGIQVNGDSNESIHHVYIGRNNLHENVQAGLGIKKSMDIIISQNESWGARTRPWSGGNGMGSQYGSEYLWFIYNHIYDNEEGIRIASDSGGVGTEHFFVGNVIHNIHKVSSYNADNAWEKAAIGIWGGHNTYIINNTIWDIDGAIYSPRADGQIILANNIIGKPTIGYHINMDKPLLTNSTLNNNLYEAPLSVKHSGDLFYSISDLRSEFGYEEHGISVSSAGFTSPHSGDLHLLPNSPAQNKGERHIVYDIFKDRYGIDIEVDFDGNPRAPSGRWELGAFEITNTPTKPTDPAGSELP